VATGSGIPTGTGTLTATGTTSVMPTITGSCAPTTNELRYDCTIDVSPPQPVDIDFWKVTSATSTTTSSPAATSGTLPPFTTSPATTSTSVVRRFTSEAVASQHTVTLMLMEPNADYDWVATPRNDTGPTVGGSWSTATLPTGAQSYGLVVGTSSEEFMLMQSRCSADGFAVIINTRTGLVNYYQDLNFTSVDPFLDGLQWTEDQTFLALVGQDVVETDIWDNPLLVLESGIDFTERIHHDVFRRNGLTLVTFSESVSLGAPSYLVPTMDGFLLFDGNTRIAEWHLKDHHLPTAEGGDYSHANSIWMDEDDNVLISLRHLSSVVSIFADPLDPLFGEVNWQLSGNPEDQALPSDFLLTSTSGATATFRQQHNAHLLPDGRLTVFDNELGVDLSKVLEITLDTNTWTANIDAHYELPQHCDFQGGAWHTDNGNPVGTCAPQATGYEFDAGSPVNRWSMQVLCTSLASAYIPRFTPWVPPDFLLKQNQP
jgi:hypothetical protein